MHRRIFLKFLGSILIVPQVLYKKPKDEESHIVTNLGFRPKSVIKFRRYTKLPMNIEPLAEGMSPTEIFNIRKQWIEDYRFYKGDRWVK